MSDDIVTRLHENCGCYAANEFGYNCTNCDAADEIERLRKLAHNLYEETKRCGSLHDTPATMDYEEWLEENE